MAEKSASVVICEMADKMKEDAVTRAKMSIDKQDSEKDISEEIKRHFDQHYGPNWHCVVGMLKSNKLGKNFCYHVSYRAKHFIFFYVGQIAVLLYKL